MNIKSTLLIYFETTDDAADIAAAYMSGKNVVFKFNNNEVIVGDYHATPNGFSIGAPAYASLVEYFPAREVGGVMKEEQFYIVTRGSSVSTTGYGSNIEYIINGSVTSNGKLRFGIYID